MAFEKPERVDEKRFTESLSRNFHDLLEAVCQRNKDLSDIFTRRQCVWIKAYQMLDHSDMFKRPCGSVAVVLGISLSASTQMKTRIEERLQRQKKSIEDDLQDKIDDEVIDMRYTRLERSLADEPEALEKIRGIPGIIHWKQEQVHHERTGRGYSTAHKGETISEKQAEKIAKVRGLSIVKRTPHDLSPGQIWWSKYKAPEKVLDMWVEIHKRWTGDNTPGGRLCAFCKCLLPLNERIEGGKIIKRNSQYCSDTCKKNAQRSRKRTVPR